MINWVETRDNSTAGFDRSFAENVLDSLMFDYDDADPVGKPVEWYTLQWGPFLSFTHEYSSNGLSDSSQRWL
jgi:hypothetical protein